MNNRLLFFLLTVLLSLGTQSVDAKVRLPAILSSNMVLQRNTEVVIWGWADPQEKITVEASWLQSKIKIQADAAGNWKHKISTTLSKDPQTLTIKSKDTDIRLEQILFGEVWLCSGQSNMYQPITGYTGQPTYGSNEALQKSNNANLRLFSVARVGSKEPLTDIKEFSSWEQASPKNVASFSAIGYFFGQQLQASLDVPVGIIHTSWGGSYVEAWMSEEALSPYQKINIESADLRIAQTVQTALFNAMINPIIPFNIKGVLWYQGESNRNQPEAYKKLFPAMVKDWRERWQLGDFPFYYVQIAPYDYKNINSAFIREAQLQCLDLIPNSGMAVTMDLGSEKDIHPPKKKEVADRLLYLALNKTYGIPQIDATGPTYARHEFSNGTAILHFDHAESGLYAFDGLKGFEVAGADRIFYPARAVIMSRNVIHVRIEKVPEPVAVRYAWKNWIEGTLFDTNLLPASSFRTDNWEEPVRLEKK
ncbi:sialate O-acetylesterase [Dyadobacter tibetensis]|uniref:sialate O-acetylesterase n=1 Tax=Dyadobacter tibetensis TaxID=1211851 RepID=UPI000471CF60|nr:sialate O-acetylesterase [Dyadobacter tibetensis]